jgi:RNA polymerase sigma-70 factor (ECF subfamily)
MRFRSPQPLGALSGENRWIRWGNACYIAIIIMSDTCSSNFLGRNPAGSGNSLRDDTGPAAATEKERVEHSDAELVGRAAKGEHAAFAILVERHAKYLYALAYSLVGSNADAEDVVQESLTGAYRGLGKFQGRAPVKIWLGGIVIRQAARFHHKRGMRPMMSIEEAANDQETPDPAMMVSAATKNIDRRLDIQTLLRKLSDAHRQIIVLRELHGFGYEEISEILGIPRGTVESRLFRARSELANLLSGYGNA